MSNILNFPNDYLKSNDLSALPKSIHAVATINLDSLIHNFRTLQELSKPGVSGAVVKANAYGMGAIEFTKALIQSGCGDFFVGYLSEAMQIKPYLPKFARIYVFNGIMPGEEQIFIDNHFIPVISTIDQLTTYFRIHETLTDYALQIDIGINRMGIRANQINQVLQDFPLESVPPLLVMGHFSAADEGECDSSNKQKNIFDQIVKNFPNSLRSLCNSGGVEQRQLTKFDVTRPGLDLHGLSIYSSTNSLIPILNLHARIIQIQEIEKGEKVGYNGTFTAEKNMRIATLAAGYADGIPWRIENKGFVSINNEKAPFVGRISMDLCVVDITGIENVALYHFAQLLDTNITLNDWAAWTGQSKYELLTHIGGRFKKFYLSQLI